MVDLTNPVESIVSILKNSSTGIGTTGYTITDDNASGLTIADGELLVAFTMSKEEVKAAFGGSQDYDVIFTVKAGEIEDEWIGLSTKIWKVPIIITIHVIDKWSAVATKYITAPLVRYKAVNALRQFIKAKTSSPGGSINTWKAVSFKDEEDTTVKPTMFKCIVTTEAWIYYNPAEATKTYQLILTSKKSIGGANNLGQIDLNGDTYSSLPGTKTGITSGTEYDATFTAAANTTFSSWETEGNISLSSTTTNPTTVTVTANGTLITVYLGCPSGEQVANGTFESGDGTSWTTSGGAIDGSNYHGGSYGWQINTEDGYITQTLATETPVGCISASSVWLKYIGCPAATAKITVTYTDDTTTIITPTVTGSWAETDIKGELTALKIVKSIKIEMTNAGYLIIDDVTITC